MFINLKMTFVLSLFFLLFPLAIYSAEPNLEEEDQLNTNVLIIFDNSGSMRGGKIDDAKNSVNHFLDGLDQKIRVGLIYFGGSGKPEVLVPLKFEGEGSGEPGKTRGEIKTKLKDLVAYGPTPLTLCLQMGGEILIPRAKSHPYERQMILLVTDGQDTVSGENSVAPILDKLSESGLTVSLVAFATKENDYLKKSVYQYFQPNNAEELKNSLKESMSESSTFTQFKGK